MARRAPIHPDGSRSHRVAAALLAALSLTCAAHAEPLLNKGGKPGVVTAWEGSGKKILLTVKEGVDPKQVAETIGDNLDRVKVKVKGGKVQVKGKTRAELLKALEDIDFGEDDFGALAEAAAEDDEDGGSGSSLRAKKSADLAKLFKDEKVTAIGRVVKVQQRSFPSATVTVQILRGPKGALGKEIRKGKRTTFIPALATKGKTPDWSREDTQLNAGAWFLRTGDKVRIKIGKQMGKTFEALIIHRQ
jgi:hypothetical protein